MEPGELAVAVPLVGAKVKVGDVIKDGLEGVGGGALEEVEAEVE